MEQPSSNRRPTIVGGSPMNRLVQASSLPLNVERLLIQAALSREFRQRLLADRETAAAEAGIDLLPEERALLSHISDETLEKTIDVVIMPPVSRRGFLKRAAASVVLALTGSAVLAQAACGGAAPDQPLSAYDKPGHYWANLADMRCFVFVPEVYELRRSAYPVHFTPLLIVLPDASQTSLEAANQWTDLCTQEGIVMIVAEWDSQRSYVRWRLEELLGDVSRLWGAIHHEARVVAGCGEAAAVALRAGVYSSSYLHRIIACGGLPGPGAELAMTAAEGTRIYLRLGRQDLNAGEYETYIGALRKVGCQVDADLVEGRVTLAEFSQKEAWDWVTEGAGL